jgi:hypothetical protein
MLCEGIVKSTGERCNKKSSYFYNEKYYCGLHCEHDDRVKIEDQKPNIKSQVITITLGDRGENNPGMEIIGKSADKGFSVEDLEKINDIFSESDYKTELIYLNKIAKYEESELPEASILIVRDFVKNQDEIFHELANLKWDRKMLSRGYVINKNARFNLCFNHEYREPNYEAGEGTIIAFKDVPLFYEFKENLSKKLENYFNDFVAEGNYYYDRQHGGIGYHGDRERKITIGIRFGATAPLCFHWYLNDSRIGEKMIFRLNGGDLYIMSDKAVGYDWLKRKIPTLRHAAIGADYIC